MRTLFRSTWLWPVILIIAVVVTAIITFVPAIADTDFAISIRPEVIMAFLFVCPGMAVVRFFRLADAVDELVFAVALSLVIGAFIASILLYAGAWSPVNIFYIILGFSLGGAVLQLLVALLRHIVSARSAGLEQHTHLKNA